MWRCALLLPLLLTLACGGAAVHRPPSLIPAPASMELTGGEFHPGGRLAIAFEGDPEPLRAPAALLAEGLRLELDEGGKLLLKLAPDAELGDEGYALDITPEGIVLSAPNALGLFHGAQTLMQLAPLEGAIVFPCLEIRDRPRFEYRGMHLDVCRHFFPVEFVKRYLDLMAMHRFNRFHWHLTEDQGWRIEIERYPELARVASVRAETLVGHYGDTPHRFDGTPHGGYYTQDEVREVVAYAAARGITVIPEIEMPGHSLAALAAYPHLACTDGPFTPATKWGVFEDVYCAGDDAVFEFLEGVLEEVIALFPGEYVHIGGDECPKTRWEQCEKCQARMISEGLVDEHELQSWFIRRIERFLNARGKRLIGWDEILEGGLAPDATVMSWRGTAGGIAAARQGHDVIMTPGSHCYFDHYQADPAHEPVAIGGLTTLKKVYAFEPVPPVLSPEEARHVLGAQANVWTEYIATPAHVEYMILPRMCALAEVLWSPKSARDWPDFQRRLDGHFPRLDAIGANYSRGSFAVTARSVFDEGEGRSRIRLESEQTGATIVYTFDGFEPGPDSPRYEEPLPFDRDLAVKAGVLREGEPVAPVSETRFQRHLAVDRPIELGSSYAARYAGGGDRALVDGILGGEHFGDGRWQGYEGQDFEATIDLGEGIVPSQVLLRFLVNTRSWIFPPLGIEVELSRDGENYRAVGEKRFELPADHEPAGVRKYSFAWFGNEARWLRVRAVGAKACPEWHSGAGGKAWLFLDEIVVE